MLLTVEQPIFSIDFQLLKLYQEKMGWVSSAVRGEGGGGGGGGGGLPKERDGDARRLAKG